MYSAEFNALQQKYANAKTPEELEIKRSLDVIAKLFKMCDESEYYYAEVITRHFCRIVNAIEKKHKKAPSSDLQPQSVLTECSVRYPSAEDLLREFYNYYKKPEQVDYRDIANAVAQGQNELVNPTMKDYVARICTFSGPKYLGKMFDLQAQSDVDPVLFTFENIERILATFKTRDDQGNILKQNVNLRSALRKLNDFKQSQGK